MAPDEIEARLTTLVSDYKVPLDEARRSVINHYLDETDASRADLGRNNQEVALATIDIPEQWVVVTTKMVDL